MKVRNSKGSITVEAALALPIFIAFMLLISSMARVYYTHEYIQDALVDAVNEVASTAYFFQVTGVTDVHKDIKGRVEEKSENAQADIELIGELIDIGNVGKSAVENGNTTGIKEAAHAGEQGLMNLADSLDHIQENPLEYAKSIASVGMLKGINKGENMLMNAYVKLLMRKHIETANLSVNERLLNSHIKDGIKGLDFSESIYFSPNEDMEIVITYTLDRVDPFGLVRDVQLTNRCKARAWLKGDSITVTNDSYQESTEGDLASEVIIDEEIEEQEEELEIIEEKRTPMTVYMTENGKKTYKYHTLKSCDTLNNAKIYTKTGEWVGNDDNGHFEFEEKTYDLCIICSNGGKLKRSKND